MLSAGGAMDEETVKRLLETLREYIDKRIRDIVDEMANLDWGESRQSDKLWQQAEERVMEALRRGNRD